MVLERCDRPSHGIENKGSELFDDGGGHDTNVLDRGSSMRDLKNLNYGSNILSVTLLLSREHLCWSSISLFVINGLIGEDRMERMLRA